MGMNLSDYFGAVPSGGGVLVSEKHTASANQTVFTLSNISYDPSRSIIVARNGSILNESEYTKTNSKTITLSNGAQSGDIIEVYVVQQVGTNTNNSWAFEHDVTTDQSPAMSTNGDLYRYTSSTTADRTLTLPTITTEDDGKLFWIQNDSDYVITVTPNSSTQSVWTSGKGYGIELAERSLVAVRANYNKSRWDVVAKTGGLVRQEGLKLYANGHLEMYVASSTSAILVDKVGLHTAYVYNKTSVNTNPLTYKFPPQCYYFVAGRNSYGWWADSPDWDIVASNTGAIVVALWVKPARTGVVETFYSHYQSSSYYWNFYKSSENKLYFDIVSGGSYVVRIGAGSMSANTWYHAALVRHGNALGLYLNGQQIAYQSLSSTYNFAGPMYMGQLGSGTYYFEGHMQDLIVAHANPYDANPNSGNTDTLSNWNRQFPGVM